MAGNILGGWIPAALERLPDPLRLDRLHAYRIVLAFGALIALAAVLPLLRLRGLTEPGYRRESGSKAPAANRQLLPIAMNALLIGAGAGLVIPFMNLYFATRFGCSSAQIGVFFSVAAVTTALAAALGPAFAKRFGKLRTATAMELLSLPFLVTLGAERRLEVAVGAFWLRATLMQAGSPLLGAFIMESLPPALRARCSSLNNTVWNAGWAVSASLAGFIIQRFGYAVPFYITATLYATAALYFYITFRGRPEIHAEAAPPGEAVLRTESAIVE